MSGFARFILVNYKQDLLGNTVDNTVDHKIALPANVTLISHLVIYEFRTLNLVFLNGVHQMQHEININIHLTCMIRAVAH